MFYSEAKGQEGKGQVRLLLLLFVSLVYRVYSVASSHCGTRILTEKQKCLTCSSVKIWSEMSLNTFHVKSKNKEIPFLISTRLTIQSKKWPLVLNVLSEILTYFRSILSKTMAKEKTKQQMLSKPKAEYHSSTSILLFANCHLGRSSKWNSFGGKKLARCRFLFRPSPCLNCDCASLIAPIVLLALLELIKSSRRWLSFLDSWRLFLKFP